MPTSIRNNRGFTLVELMSAIIVALVGLLGLVQAMNYAAQENFRGQQRDEAVQVAEQWMGKFRNAPFNTNFSMISTCAPPTCTDGKYSYAPQTVPSRLRNGNAYYTVWRTTTVNASDSHIDLGVRVRYKFKNMSTTYEVHSVRYRDDQ